MTAGEERSTRSLPVLPQQYDSGILGTRREQRREILIAGTDLSALVTAGLLDGAGFDPLIAPSPRDRSPPRVTVIWEPGLRVLEELGLRQSVEQRGEMVTELDRSATKKSWEAKASTDLALVAIEREQLRALLARAVRTRIRETDRVVTGLESVESGVRATFDRASTESFDVAVTADRSLNADHTTEFDGPVHTWECHQFEQTRKATESWGPSAAIFATPTSDSTSVRLVSTAETPASAAVSADDIADRFSHLSPPMVDLRKILKNSGFEYRRVRVAAPMSVSHGRIGWIGPAARTAIPGTHLGPSTDIETAWALATAIDDAPETMTEALSLYEQRRRKLSARFRTWFDDDHGTALSLSPALRLVFFARQLVFSHVTGSPQSFRYAIGSNM
jgi:2-polyprenyl-6-methoxyphenol hydroxylase-like FAD-dependent oxidoreductase